MSDTLICSIQMSKTAGITVTVQNDKGQITQTITMDGTTVTLTVKHNDKVSTITQDAEHLELKVVGTETSTVTQKHDSVAVVCKNFSVTAEMVDVKSSKDSTHHADGKYTVTSTGDMAQTTQAKLALKSTSDTTIDATGKLTASAVMDATLKATQNVKIEGTMKTSMEGKLGVDIKGLQINATADAKMELGGPMTTVGKNLTTISGQMIKLDGALVKIGLGPAMDEKSVEKFFLMELEALEHFRISYTGLYRDVPLTREDPDVRRLIEALAFFSARTRLASERSVNESLLRLFRQHFPYALSPLPATTLLQARTTPRFVEAVRLPRGIEVMVEPKAAKGTRPTFRFRTLAELRVLPIELVGVRTVVVNNKPRRILLNFSTSYPRREPIEELSLHIDHLNDLLASMAVFYALKSHLTGASVVYGDDVPGDAQGQGCEVSFGPVEVPPHEFEAFEHPVERFRAFLHFPQGELYVHFRGIKHHDNWQHFTLCLDINESWPIELTLTPDSFALNVVPMSNLKRDMANPVEHDGTQERHLLMHPDNAARYVLHSILGVYQLTEQGMEPVEPGVLGPTRMGYETSFEGKDERRRGWLLLDLPGAFDKPERVAVEACWTQPGITGMSPDELGARLADRHVDGLQWECVGALAAPASSEIEDNRDELLALTGLKSQRVLGLDELTFLVRALGSLRRPEFARLTLAMTQVNHSTKPAAGQAGGLCQVYDLRFDNLDGSDLPRLDLFCSKILFLLRTWSVEQVVELVARVPRLNHEARYTS